MFAIAATISVLFAWAFHLLCLGVGFHYKDNALVTTGSVGFAHLLVHGVTAVRIPRARLRGRRRQRNMREQRGHTKMLMYFIGMGPLSEVCMFSSAACFEQANRHFTNSFAVALLALSVGAAALSRTRTVSASTLLGDDESTGHCVFDMTAIIYASVAQAFVVAMWGNCLRNRKRSV